MHKISVVCSSCRRALSSALAERSWSPHHSALQEFKEAVAQQCYVCTVLWDSLSERHQNAWTHDSELWEPMRYRAYRDEDEEEIVRLEIMFLNAEKNCTQFMKYRLISSEDHGFGDVFSHEHLEGKTSTLSALKLISKWCSVCSESHTRCNQLADGKPRYPTRIIEIGLGENDTTWRLYIPTNHEVLSTPYITLSYRWGLAPQLVLSTSNLDEFCRGKLIRDLPQTFKDLVVVARWLSVRYIWIDALCIIQNSVEDWQVESANMQHVYAKSLCNIAASASSDPKGGLFRSRDLAAIRPGLVAASFSTSTPKLYFIFDKSYSQRQMMKGPLHNRGWVFQERLLAPRVIYFAENQVFWECFTESKCEGFPAGIPLHSPLKNFDCLWELSENGERQQIDRTIHWFNLWNDLVKEYSQCALTKQSDKLLAIGGLASLFLERTNDQYVVGMWKGRLAEHLDWRVYEPVVRIESNYRAPSWSWAAVDGPVDPQGLNTRTKMHITVKDVYVQQLSSNAMGLVTGGHIQISGLVIQARTHVLGDTGFYEITTQESRARIQICPDYLGIDFEEKSICCLVLKTEPEYTMFSDKEECHEAFSVVFLVLEAQLSVPAEYKRIGHFVVRDGEILKELGIHVGEDGLIEPGAGSQCSTISLV